MKRLLTIQDISCVGQCSLTVALPVISACGVETAILPSAVLSTHTGFPHFRIHDLTDDMPLIEEKWLANGLTFDAFYTGYVRENQIQPILDIMERCAAPNAVRIVDPVMADYGKLYAGFDDDFPSKLVKLCDGADYILPNLTEAALLLNETPVLEGYDRAYIEGLLKRLRDTGAKHVLLTGVSFEPSKIGFAMDNGQEVSYYFTERVNRMSFGTGDVYASVFAGALLRGMPAFGAASLAADIVRICIRDTPPEHWYGVNFETALPSLIHRLQDDESLTPKA
ncbi:MAG: bifunctional hydroxymethylpyrimidine kinase/phosphomethylpyrimidine kinase [Victivallales bacterium]|nr:bifunctional hydroxymethylpyrimidine kinase/phosphomethylpyrimidine kinase [Victivallales bacterium]